MRGSVDIQSSKQQGSSDAAGWPEFPLSCAQQSLWVAEQGLAGVAGTNYSLPVQIDGVIDVNTLQSALQDVVVRHEILRTNFAESEGVVRQRVRQHLDEPPVAVQVVSSLEEWAMAKMHRFDLLSEIPIRAHLGSFSSTLHMLLLVVNGLAMDAWSVRPLLNDLSTAYAARRRGNPGGLSSLPLQYSDFIAWERQALAGLPDVSSPYARQLSFWEMALASMPKHLRLPVDHWCCGPSDSTGFVAVRLNPSLHNQCLRLAREAKVGISVLLHSVLSVLLSRLGAGYDLPFATTVPGRCCTPFYDVIGPFANFLIVRSDISGNPTFWELIGRVHAAYLYAYHNQDVPFSVVAQKVDASIALGRAHLVPVMFTVRTARHAQTIDLVECRFSLKAAPAVIQRFDLDFDLQERRGAEGNPEGVEGVIRYNTHLFKHASIERLLSQFVCVLRSGIENPDQRVDQLAMSLCKRELAMPGLGASQGRYVGRNIVRRLEGVFESSKRGGVVCGSPRRATSRPDGRQLYVAPGNPTQYQLVRIWERLIGVRRIGIWDDFADLGGNRMLHCKMLDAIQEFSGQDLSGSLDSSLLTVEAISAELVRRLPASLILKVQEGNAMVRAPFFFLHGDVDGGGYYALEIARSLDASQPLYALQPHGLNGQNVPDSIEDMALDYIGALRRLQPQGPYKIGGYCNSGLVAFEMARQLVLDGQQVGLLILICTRVQSQPSLNESTPCTVQPKPGPRTAIRADSLFDRHMSTCLKYVPSRYPGQATLFWPLRDRITQAARAQWERVCNEIEFRHIEGTHDTCVTQFVAKLGGEINRSLSQVCY